jgi:hypothetical protein
MFGIQCVFLTVTIGNCMVKIIPPVNFCSDENMYSNHFWNKFGRFFKLSIRSQFNILNCRKNCKKIFCSAPVSIKECGILVGVESLPTLSPEFE